TIDFLHCSVYSIFYYLLFHPRCHPSTLLFPYTTLFRSHGRKLVEHQDDHRRRVVAETGGRVGGGLLVDGPGGTDELAADGRQPRSEEHTSELQSRENLVCRLLLEKKKTPNEDNHNNR